MVELRRELGLKEVVATVVTNVIGVGLFISTVQIQSKVDIGSGVILAFIIAAIPTILIALSYSVLATIFPSSGGEYVFISRILDPYLGFIATWSRWFAMIATIAAMSVGDLILIQGFFSMASMSKVSSFIGSHMEIIAVGLVLLFLMVNYVGVKVYGKVQTGMFILLIVGMALLIIFGLPHVNLNNISCSWKWDFSNLAKATSLIFFSYIGFATIVNAAGEVKNPEKNLPRGILISTIAIAILYVLVATVTYGSISPSRYSSYDFSSGSVPDIMASLFPPIVALYVSFAGAISIISDINPAMLATSRLTFAWAEDRIVPEKLAELNRFRVPKWTLIINAIVAITIIALAKEFMSVVMMINIAILIVYILVCISALVLPYKHPDIYKKATFRFRGLWIVSLAGAFSSAALLGYLLNLPGAMSGYLFLLFWCAVGTIIYVLTLESHKMYWRLEKQRRKEKEEADKEFIKDLIKAVRDQIIGGDEDGK